MLTFLKNNTPDTLKREYHRVQGWRAARKSGFPARDMVIVGITGTKGKTSTANFVWSVLHAGGYKTGLISSANFRVGTREEPNPYHMTMPNPFFIQMKLREMRDSGMEIAVMEMTSEGMKQFRHIGIPVDIAIFTNLTPEHLTSHKGSFEEYKKAKGALFAALGHTHKTLRGKTVPHMILANADSEHAPYYLGFPADIKQTFGVTHGDLVAQDIDNTKEGIRFTAGGETYRLAIPGGFNVHNALPAIMVGKALGVAQPDICAGLETLAVIPGRMEAIEEGQDFGVYVDYAHEPASLGAVLTAAEHLRAKGSKTILLFGGQGGGRDWRKREPMAQLAATRADYVIVSNEDPYEDDPQKIVDELAQGVASFGKTLGRDLFPLFDRRAGIRKALQLARKGDIVLITGKGAEQTMMVKGGAIPWNEREIVREAVKAYVRTNNH